MDYVPSFESAWSIGAEAELSVPDYARKRLVHRRQKIVHLAKALGWRFLKVGESLPPGNCLLVAIRLDSLRDLQLLDLLRANQALGLGRAVCLFHVERPYVLPIPGFPGETPAIAVVEEGRTVARREGDAAFRYAAGAAP